MSQLWSFSLVEKTRFRKKGKTHFEDLVEKAAPSPSSVVNGPQEPFMHTRPS